MTKPVRILVADDHSVVREGLKALLERQGHFKVVAEAETGEEAIEKAQDMKPDVAVLDIRMPGLSGIEACRQIVRSVEGCRVIMLTSYADEEAVFASIMAGATGYLLKQTRTQTLTDAIERAMRGESLLDPAVTQRVLERVRTAGAAKDDELSLLSEQERKILDLIAEGKTNKEIAKEVYLSDKTVKNYVSRILSKLNLRRRSEAAAFIASRRPRTKDSQS